MRSPVRVGRASLDAMTIAAIATPPGRGAIAIVRISGPQAGAIAMRLTRMPAPLRPRHAYAVNLHDARGALLDRGVALFFAAPKSYTGEDVLELHVHGSPVVARCVLEAAVDAGAAPAAPGEFTRRAYCNGKMKLSAAAAVADLIAAETRAAARAAAANLAGGLAAEIERLRRIIRGVLEELAGAIDFPDEVPEPERRALDATVASVEADLHALRRTGEIGRVVREGVSVAIVGPPNAGKSSLLNALLREERAIVSEMPGTTRDTIEEAIVVDGVPVRLIDTAGIRAHADLLESTGIERTIDALARARIALVTLDGSRPLGPAERDVLERTRERERVVFCNKADLGTVGARALAECEPIVGSVFDPLTQAALRAAIARVGWNDETIDLARPHLATAAEMMAATQALAALADARATLAAGEPVDLCAGDLQQAVAALGHVNGEDVAEEVVDGIFARFCIGK